MKKRGTKDVDLLGLPEGYTLRLAGRSNHFAVICPDGMPLRMPGGIPVRVALTPGDRRTRRLEATRIRRALEVQEADLGSAPRPDSERRR